MKVKKFSISSDTVQTIPFKFAVMTVRRKAYIILSQTDDRALHSRSQLSLKLDKLMFNLYYNSHISDSI